MPLKSFEILNTSFVSLRGLIRHLQQENFSGTIRIVFPDYEAEVLLRGAEALEVSDGTTPAASSKPGAFERLMVHSREPGGTITVVEEPSTQAVSQEIQTEPNTPSEPIALETDWVELMDVAGRVVAAVERAADTVGADFKSIFRAVRIEMGDDYVFLDPTTDDMKYDEKRLELHSRPTATVFVNALSGCLGRAVDKFSAGKDAIRIRETVAIELAVAARMRTNRLGQFTNQLDSIAGTRVL